MLYCLNNNHHMQDSWLWLGFSAKYLLIKASSPLQCVSHICGQVPWLLGAAPQLLFAFSMKHVPNVIQCSGLPDLQSDSKERQKEWVKKKKEKEMHYDLSVDTNCLYFLDLKETLWKKTSLLPCPPALEKYPDVSDSTQQPHQNAPTLLMCYQGFHWLFLLRSCPLLF